MRKIRLGIYISDEIYRERFCRYLMNYYSNQLQVDIYTDQRQILEEPQKGTDIWVLEGWQEKKEEGFGNNLFFQNKMIYLCDSKKGIPDFINGGINTIVDKYLDVNQIVDIIMGQIGNEVCEIRSVYGQAQKKELIGVYGLSAVEYQLPFSITLGAVIGEKRHVLLIDLQENSGISYMLRKQEKDGLEDLLVMISDGSLTAAKVRSCMGHLDHVDCLYPSGSAESLCEVDAGLYESLIRFIMRELDYSLIIINFGSRFPGFFTLFEKCRQIWMPEKKSAAGEFRRKLFFEEMENRGNMQNKIISVDITSSQAGNLTCDRIVEQWRWNTVGNYIRKVALEDSLIG